MIKELMVNTTHIIKAYNYIGGAMSLIYCNFKDYNNWLVQNFSLISWRKLWNNLDFNMRKLGKWECLSIKKRHVYNTKELIRWVKEGIDSNCYVYMFVNEYYMEYSDNYLGRYFKHDLFIVGYNDKKSELMVLAYTKNRKFERIIIPYINLENAYKSLYLHKNIKFIAINNEFTHTDNDKLQKNLKTYYSIMEKKVYNPMIKKLRRNIHSHDSIDFKSLKIFSEHKFVLSLWKNEFNELHLKANQVIMLLIKYELNKNTELLARIMNLLEAIKEKEKKLLKRLVCCN